MTRPLCAAVLAGLLLAAAPADAQRTLWEEDSGYWIAYAYEHEDGFRHCGIETNFSFDDGSWSHSVQVKTFEDGLLTLDLSDADWQLAQDEAGTIVVRIGRYQRSLRAEALSDQLLSAIIPDDDWTVFWQAFEQSWQMEIDFPRQQDWAVDLRGTANASRLSAQCVKRYLDWGDGGSTSPFGTGSGGSSSPF
jgi:hypothetical protein